MKLQFYKKGQGYYTRLGTAIGTFAISALACMALYNTLEGLSLDDANLKSWIQAGVPAVLFVVLGWVIFKLVNMPRLADFMIQTEGEMKKVSWSSKKEIIASTKIVIVTVVILAIILAMVDFGFAELFHKIGVLKVMG
jgi:preprotein translocase subunit SecE